MRRNRTILFMPGLATAAMLLGRVLLAQTIAMQAAPLPLGGEPAAAEEADEDEEAIFGLDIAELRHTPVAPALEMEVSAVSRQPSTVGRSPAPNPKPVFSVDENARLLRAAVTVLRP